MGRPRKNARAARAMRSRRPWLLGLAAAGAAVPGVGAWLEVGSARHDFMGFKAHPQETGVFYSSGHPQPDSTLPNPIGFMVSRDEGSSWQSVALAGRADFHALAVQASDGDVIYGFSGAVDPGLFRSLDGGRSWEKLPSPSLERLGGAYAMAVHPEARDVLLAGTQAGLLQSSDAGQSWTTLAFDGTPVTAVTFASDNRRIWAYGADPEVGLVVSDDAGASWSSVNLPLAEGDAAGYIATVAGTIYVGSFGQGLYRSEDGGNSWRQLAERGMTLP